MFYVRDRFTITAGIAAEPQYARVWLPAGLFVNDPAVADNVPTKYPVMIHRLQAAVYTTLGYLRRGVAMELCTLTDQRGQHTQLPTQPGDGISGPFGISYQGPPFLCEYGVGWWICLPALADTNSVYLWIAWDRKF